MRGILSIKNVAAAALAGLMLLAPPQARAEFTGGGSIHSPYGCEAAGWPWHSEMTRARYRAVETDGGTHSEVTLLFAVGGLNTYRIPGTLTRANTFRVAYGASVWGSIYSMARRPRVRVLERESFPYINQDIRTAQDIRLQLRIRNFNGAEGCAVTVSLVLHQAD